MAQSRRSLGRAKVEIKDGKQRNKTEMKNEPWSTGKSKQKKTKANRLTEMSDHGVT